MPSTWTRATRDPSVEAIRIPLAIAKVRSTLVSTVATEAPARAPRVLNQPIIVASKPAISNECHGVATGLARTIPRVVDTVCCFCAPVTEDVSVRVEAKVHGMATTDPIPHVCFSTYVFHTTEVPIGHGSIGLGAGLAPRETFTRS